MRSREEFNIKCNDILNTMDVYGVMRQTQLDAIFPDQKKAISYLVRNKRLYHLADGSYLGHDQTAQPNKLLIAAISTLVDVISKVTYHTIGSFPVQIMFTTVNGDYYEIVYVEQGKESLIASAFKSLGVQHGINDTTKRVAIIEDITQIEKTCAAVPNIIRFALVSDDGFMYFNKL